MWRVDHLRINRVLAWGESKFVDIRFKDGFNVIEGDNSSGKTSLFHIMAYGLGRKRAKLSEDMLSKLKYVCIEIVSLNSNVTTFLRKINKSGTKHLGVSYSRINEIKDIGQFKRKSIESVSRSFFQSMNPLNSPPNDLTAETTPKMSITGKEGRNMEKEFTWDYLIQGIFIREDAYKDVFGLIHSNQERNGILDLIFEGYDFDRKSVESQINKLKTDIRTLGQEKKAINKLISELELSDNFETLDYEINKFMSLLTELKSKRDGIVHKWDRKSTEEEKGLENEISELNSRRNMLSEQYTELSRDYERIEKTQLKLISNSEEDTVRKKSLQILFNSEFSICPECGQELTAEQQTNICRLCGEEKDDYIEEVEKNIDYIQNVLLSMGKEKEEINESIRKTELLIQESESSLIDKRRDLEDYRKMRSEKIDKNIEGLANKIEDSTKTVEALKKNRAILENLGQKNKETAALKSEIRNLERIIEEWGASDLNRKQLVEKYMTEMLMDVQQRFSNHPDFKITINEKKRSSANVSHRWCAEINGKKLGEEGGMSSKIMATLAYHLALLCTSINNGFLYPPLLVLDSPKQADTKDLFIDSILKKALLLLSKKNIILLASEAPDIGEEKPIRSIKVRGLLDDINPEITHLIQLLSSIAKELKL